MKFLCKLANFLTPKQTSSPVEIIYQSIEDLHDSCPDNTNLDILQEINPTPVFVETKLSINLLLIILKEIIKSLLIIHQAF